MFVKQGDIYIYQGTQARCIQILKELASHKSYLLVDNENVEVDIRNVELELEVDEVITHEVKHHG